MSPIYTPGKVVLRKTWQPMDADAAAYITAVETADGQALEEKVKIAIDNFVLGCKADGIWSAIKASCILAGARTLSGALVPLVGTAPTNFNFVAGDYNRETGLKGNGTNSRINTNRLENQDPQNSFHFSVYISEANTATSNFPAYIATVSQGPFNYIGRLDSGKTFFYNRTSSYASVSPSNPTGLLASNRSSSSSYVARINGSSTTITAASAASGSNPIGLYARDPISGTAPSADPCNARLAFYSIGESLDLAKLDARVTDLITAIGVAIP